MTAEVAVLNREAVAIAADSAVTLSAPERDERKIYNTANKIFVLSETEPVAVMVYGPTSFGPIPWETVVKEYRRTRRGVTCPTVEDYATDLISHLSTTVPDISEDYQRVAATETVWSEFRALRASVLEEIQALVSSGVAIADINVDSLLIADIELRVDQLRSGGYFDGFTEELGNEQVGLAMAPWPEFVQTCLPDLTIADRVSTALRELAAASMCCYSDRRSSGVVVTGFGTEELFPALSHYAVDGVLAGRVRSRHIDSIAISAESLARIRAFAQDDMVATFMVGMDPGHRVAVHRFFDETVGTFIERLAERSQSHLERAPHELLIRELNDIHQELVEYWKKTLDEYMHEQTTSPIMSIVALLPKEELAELAEALVNLTSFKRRVTPAAETVGGPVDVAVISKGDGLVWLKRKHYFPPELNPRYFRRLGFEVPGSVTTEREQS